jgi:predicted dienelactone hydrolase
MVMSVGYELAQVFDEGRDLRIPVLVTYPTSSAEKTEQLGPFSLSVARDAAPLEGAYALVIISHGSGGTSVSHRELARHLASRGFVVGVPEHPHNNRNDNTLADSVELLRERPGDIRIVADWFFDHSRFSPFLKRDAFSVVGHSMGAYTALAVAGGVPTSLPHQSPDRQPKRIEIEPDPRVKSLVLLAPATPWFRSRGSLDQVRTPILMIASYHDELAPYFYLCQIVLDGVPESTRVDYRLVENAGHYSFLSPWPDAMKSPAIPPSLDPPGFDRRRFLDETYAEIEGFLARTL